MYIIFESVYSDEQVTDYLISQNIHYMRGIGVYEGNINDCYIVDVTQNANYILRTIYKLIKEEQSFILINLDIKSIYVWLCFIKDGITPELYRSLVPDITTLKYISRAYIVTITQGKHLNKDGVYIPICDYTISAEF